MWSDKDKTNRDNRMSYETWEGLPLDEQRAAIALIVFRVPRDEVASVARLLLASDGPRLGDGSQRSHTT